MPKSEKTITERKTTDMHFENITYLKTGTVKQRLAFAVLTEERIMADLKLYDPLLVGTLPIGIDIETSDLDIICCWTNKDKFATHIHTLFGERRDFKLWENDTNNAVIARFSAGDFEIELFGQSIPTRQQSAYRHMIIEDGILQQKGSAFREQVIALKKQGYKTEPAFARLLNIKGDPYEALLNYKTAQV